MERLNAFIILKLVPQLSLLPYRFYSFMNLCLACSVVVGEAEVPHIVGRWRVHREISILAGRETEREAGKRCGKTEEGAVGKNFTPIPGFGVKSGASGQGLTASLGQHFPLLIQRLCT